MVKTLKQLQDVLGDFQDTRGAERAAARPARRAGRRARRPGRADRARRRSSRRSPPPSRRRATTSPAASRRSPRPTSGRWCATPSRSGRREDRRHLLDQGRRGEDLGGRQPRHARRPRRAAHADLGPRPAGRRLVPVPHQAEGQGRGEGADPRQGRPAVRDEGHRRRGPRPAARGLLLPPPRHRARQAQEAARAPHARCSTSSTTTTTSRSSTARPSISLVSESIFSAADLLLVPIVPSTLSVRTFEQLQGFLASAGESAPGRARVPLDGRPPQEAPPRADGVAAAHAAGGGRRPRSRRPAWSS